MYGDIDDLWERTPCPLHVHDADGVIRRVNAAWLSWLGYAREDVEGALHLGRVLDPASQGLLRERPAGFAAPGPSGGVELVMVRKDGTCLTALAHALADVDADGRLALSRCAFVDISDRRRSEQHLRRMIDAAPDATVVVDTAGRIESTNLQTERLFGYTRAELVGQPVEILIPESLRAAHVGHRSHFIRAAKLRPMGVNLDLFGQRKDGSSFPLEISLSPIESADGPLVAAAIRDVTERKQAQMAARLAGERLSQAIECIDKAFVIFDRDGHLLMHNSAYRAFLGAAVKGPLIGRTAPALAQAWSDAQGLGPADRVQWLASQFTHLNQPYLVNDVEFNGFAYRETMRRTQEGGAVLMISDRTDDHRREEALRKASAAKSDFLSSMSHELRTPLNAVLGFAQLLQRDRRTPLSPRQLNMVEHILTGGEHLLHLIDEVLDLSRIEAGRLALSIEPIVLAKVLETALASLSAMAARANVEVLVTPEISAVPPVLADRTRFAQILMNFGSNAIKYSPPGTCVRITASTPAPGQVRVTVVDTGVGIPTSEQAKLFQPFYRGTQAGGAIEGTGIGLAITKRLAELMNGTVGFRSTAGAGSEFWVELPAAREPEPAQPASKSAGPHFTDLNRKHVIVYIEDHPANITFMRELLTDFPGLELLTAPSGELGVELIRVHQPQVVIIDINLPGMSGLEAVGLLRSWPETRTIPAIALSAAAMQHDIARARAAGFDHYLTKPVQVDELLKLLEELLVGPMTSA